MNTVRNAGVVQNCIIDLWNPAKIQETLSLFAGGNPDKVLVQPALCMLTASSGGQSHPMEGTLVPWGQHTGWWSADKQLCVAVL